MLVITGDVRFRVKGMGLSKAMDGEDERRDEELIELQEPERCCARLLKAGVYLGTVLLIVAKDCSRLAETAEDLFELAA
jgi:hypothetical protein